MTLENHLTEPPADIEQALWYLKRAFDLCPGDGLLLANSTEEHFVTVAHMSLAGWVRNNWLHPDGAPLRTFFAGMGVTDRDKMSDILMRCLWRDWHGQRRDLAKLYA